MPNFRLHINTFDLDNQITNLRNRVTRVNVRAEAARVQATRAMAERARQQMVDNLEEPKSGVLWQSPPLPRFYRLGIRPSGTNRDFPATQYGELIDSIVIHTAPDGNANLNVGEGLYRPYHWHLEFGWTTRSGRSVRFPFIRRSVAEIPKREFTEIVADEVIQQGLW